MKLARVIVFSADVRKLARWYIDVFGLDANEISDGWADLGSVALHSGGASARATAATSWSSTRRT